MKALTLDVPFNNCIPAFDLNPSKAKETTAAQISARYGRRTFHSDAIALAWIEWQVEIHGGHHSEVKACHFRFPDGSTLYAESPTVLRHW